MKRYPKNRRQAGFSLLEMMVVVILSLIIGGMAVQGYLTSSTYLRMAGDLRELNAIVSQAKMQAASDFTHARFYADLSGNTFQLQVWNKTGVSATKGCWTSSGPGAACITFTGSAPSGTTQGFATGDSFGFGSHVTKDPTTATIAQPPTCFPGDATGPDGGTAITNTACLEFNSRGVPMDYQNHGIYVLNKVVVDGVTVASNGFIQTWSTPVGSDGTSWNHQ